MNQLLSRKIFVLSLLILVFFSCNPGNYKPILQSRTDALSDTLRNVKTVNSKAPESDVYRIQAQDMLAVKNYKLTEVEDGSGAGGSGGGSNSQGGGSTGGFRVEQDGTVNLPVVGKVYVMNLTRKEATDKIQALYQATVLKDPVIDVSVINQRVTILGEISAPGSYNLGHENTLLTEVIALAGGFSSRADVRTLRIIRGDKSNPEIIYANLENLSSLASPKLVLQNNDIIYVEPDKKYSNYDKSQSSFGIFQSVFLVISTGLLIFTSFFK